MLIPLAIELSLNFGLKPKFGLEFGYRLRFSGNNRLSLKVPNSSVTYLAD